LTIHIVHGNTHDKDLNGDRSGKFHDSASILGFQLTEASV